MSYFKKTVLKRRSVLFAFSTLALIVVSSCSKKEGCTDLAATNYSSEATTDDGSCTFSTVTSTTNTNTSTSFTLTSTAIQNGELLAAFKCETKTNNIENSIPLSWENVPAGTNSLAIIMEHFPNPADQINANSYLLLWDIASSVTSMPYGTADDGPWYMGSNKDGDAISYTSPCSPTAGTHAYSIIIYALSATPASLPTQSDLSIDRTALKNAISTVTVIGTAQLDFNDVN